MAMNFTQNVDQYTQTQKSVREKNFVEYSSKKNLTDACVLNEDQLAFVTAIRGTFNFALHKDGRYMAVTLYKGSNERKYTFLVLDLQEKAIAEAPSIKIAKQEILAIVAPVAEDVPAAEDAPAEEPAPEGDAQDAPKPKKNRKK